MPVPPEFAAGNEPPVALVTGGAKRIGGAFAEALAAEGFRVAIHCNRSREEAEALGRRLAAAGAPAPIVVAADLAAPDVGRQILDALPQAPAVLVNNASLFEDDRIEDFATERFDRHMAVNLRAPALLVQEMAQRLPADRNGLVINLLDAKLSSLNPDFFTYTLSKIGLDGMTELAARSLAPRIRVNAIAPAITVISGYQSRENFAAAHLLNPLARGVEPAHLVAALLYLLHTPTVTGQTLTVDAGQRFLGLPRDVAYMVPA
ncbi:MAG: SDR family NAD(P)-dependent oxidoreductase [Sphingomonadaceae bacterium]